MKKTHRFILLAAASTFFAACGAPAANTGANNANTNTTKPVAAAPTADALMALDKQANEAYVKGDSKFFEGMLSDKFVILTGGGQRMDKTAANSNTASNTAAPARATPDANTDALVKVELAVWEAWKAHDAKKLDDLMAKDVSFVNIFGTYLATRADALKDWTGANCEIKSVNVTYGFASALSPTVEMLTRKGTADGTCGGQNVGGTAIWGVSIYVKDGDAWKFAFGMNSPAM